MKQFFSTKLSYISLLGLLFLTSFIIQGQTLKNAAAVKGKYIGTILNQNYFRGTGNEAEYLQIVGREFNAVVAENNHKVSELFRNEPVNSDGSFKWNFTINDMDKEAIDTMAGYGDAQTIRRGHALMWYNQAPGWLVDRAKNSWTKEQIYDFAKQYITVLINYTAGSFQEWDVFNEAISDTSSEGFRQDAWYSGVGSTNQDIQEFIDFCFRTANDADSGNKIKLFYNDYSIEFFNNDGTSKNGFMRSMVQGMIDRGVPIDGVGLQGHFVSNSNFDAAAVGLTIDAVSGMKDGMICNITELDLRICNNDQTPTIEELETQEDNYRDILEVAMSKPGSTGLMFWGFTDKYSWIPGSSIAEFNGCDNALLYDKSYIEKPAYNGVIAGIQNATSPIPQSPSNAAPFSITATASVAIPFVEFDNGGSGVSYFDTTIGQEAGADGSGDVDTFGDSVIGYTVKDEWLEYTVNVVDPGNYSVAILTTSDATGIGSIAINGNDVSGPINFPNTGSFNDYVVTMVTIPLQSGVQVLRFSIDEGRPNLDSMTFSFESTLGTNTFTAVDNLQLYPVPFDNVINISFSGIADVQTFQLIDIAGRKVYELQYEGNTSVQLQPENLDSGLYFIKTIFNNNAVKIMQVMKK